MVGRYQIKQEQGWVEQTIDGLVTLPELFAFIATNHADPQWHHDLLGVTDLRTATLNFTFDDMIAVATAEEGAGVWSQQPWAYVLPQGDTAMYGTLRMYQNIVEGTRAPVALFFDLDDARSWLAERRRSLRAQGGAAE
jgi:hypothetical protein